jgi:N-methylhydantoinase A
MLLSAFDAAAANAVLEDLVREATAHCRAAAGGRPIRIRRSAFMRYAGQGHEILVPLADGALGANDVGSFRGDFEREYSRLFARHIPDAEIEIMSFMALATTPSEPPTRLAAVGEYTPGAAVTERSVLDTRLGHRQTVAVFERRALLPGSRIRGPALIVEEGTSTYVSPSFDAAVDAGHALVLTARS